MVSNMIDTKTIEDFLVLERMDFDDINKFANNKIREKLVGNCYKDHGYVLDVLNTKITDNKISPIDSNIILYMNIEISYLMPEKGSVYKGKVIMVFNKGIFVEILDVLKILVSVDSLKDLYDYEDFTNCFIPKDNSKELDIINKGEEVSVCIKGLRYSKNMYNCFGDIVDN